jgi:hypothetical protein
VQIAKDALDGGEMRLPRIMHVEADLYCISDVRRVKVRYCKAPTRLRYNVDSGTGEPSEERLA